VALVVVAGLTASACAPISVEVEQTRLVRHTSRVTPDGLPDAPREADDIRLLLQDGSVKARGPGTIGRAGPGQIAPEGWGEVVRVTQAGDQLVLPAAMVTLVELQDEAPLTPGSARASRLPVTPLVLSLTVVLGVLVFSLSLE